MQGADYRTAIDVDVCRPALAKHQAPMAYGEPAVHLETAATLRKVERYTALSQARAYQFVQTPVERTGRERPCVRDHHEWEAQGADPVRYRVRCKGTLTTVLTLAVAAYPYHVVPRFKTFSGRLANRHTSMHHKTHKRKRRLRAHCRRRATCLAWLRDPAPARTSFPWWRSSIL